MTKEEWKLLDNDDVKDATENTNNEDTQASERKRRLLYSSKTKTHRRYIQDIVSFLHHEAAAADEQVQYEHRPVGADHMVRVSVGGDTAEARKKTLKTAKEAAAKEMMRMIGPWIEDEMWRQYSETVTTLVPGQYQSTWLPAVFDARHVSIDEDVWYEVELQLGPVSIVSVNNSLNTCLESLVKHSCHFLTTSDLDTLIREPLEESLQEMEVSPHLNQPYVQSRDLITVRMDAADGSQLTAPVDLFTLQQYLPEGRLPSQYGGVDVYGCKKLFQCNVTGEEFSGVDNLISHCHSLKYWRRIGKIFINGQLRSSFCPAGDPGDPGDHHPQHLGYPDIVHPVADQQAGRPVDKNSLQYSISVLRCADMLQTDTNKPPSLLDLNCEKPGGLAYKPPDSQNSGGGFGGMYDDGQGFKAGWEDPYAPKMGWDHGDQGGQFGFGRGGFAGPRMGYGGPRMGFGGYGPGPGHMGFRGPNGAGWGNRMRFNGPGFGQKPRQHPASTVPAPENAEAMGMKKKITAEKKLEKYSGGEVVMPEGEEEGGNAAYTGKMGKTGFSENNKKEKPRYSALPPPGHSQWNNISGNENFKIDNSMANLKPVGANFKANKSGVRVCIPWKRGMCKLGDRCNYTHGDPGHNKLQSLVDAQLSPLEKDLSGYRIAADVAKNAVNNGSSNNSPQKQSSSNTANNKQTERGESTVEIYFINNFLDVSAESMNDDWFSDGPSEVSLRSIDKDAIFKSIQTAKHKMGDMETDFTQVKKKSKWD